MLHVGLDLSRTRLDVHVMDEAGAPLAVTTAAPDAGGVASLAHRGGELGGPGAAGVGAVNGGRLLPCPLEVRGWGGGSADAGEVEGVGPPGCQNPQNHARGPA